MDDCIQLLKPLADKKNISIISDIAATTEACFDEMSMHTVCRNLIGNAIKFTNTSGEIRITAEKQDDKLAIHVIDNGVGMSPETIQKIFNQNQHLSTRGTNNETGIGLGFVVVKEFVEKNNGSIQIFSELELGTSVIVNLPTKLTT